MKVRRHDSFIFVFRIKDVFFIFDETAKYQLETGIYDNFVFFLLRDYFRHTLCECVRTFALNASQNLRFKTRYQLNNFEPDAII